MFPFDDLPSALLAFCVIATGYVVFGISGFGASLLTIPLLSHVYPVPFVLALAAVVDLGAGLLVSGRTRRDAETGEIRWLLPFAVVGAVLGTTLLVNLPRQAMLLSLALFIGGYGVYGLAARAPTRVVSRGWAPVAGLCGGITGTLFGMGGPPYLIYLSRRLLDKDKLRATMSSTVAVSLVVRVGVFAAAGLLFQPELAKALLLFAPAAALGVAVGSRVHLALSHAALLRILYAVLLASGSSLMWRALSVPV